MEPSGGTVLKIGSHRAGERLARALGRCPARYYTWQHGGVFVVLYSPAEVQQALEIKSVGRTRVREDQVGLCIPHLVERAKRCADLWAGGAR